VIRTGLAEAEDLDKMGDYAPLKPVFHLVFDFIGAAENQVFDPFATRTDKVVVVLVIMTVIIVKLAIRMDNLHDDAFFAEEFQVPIYGG